MGKYDYLISQGWTQEEAEKYVEAQEKGHSPLEAYKTVKETPKQEIRETKRHEAEETPEEEAYEHAKEQLKSGVKEVKEFAHKTKENIKSVAGLAPRESLLKKAAGSVLLALKPKQETEKEKRRREQLEEAYHQRRVKIIKSGRIAPASIQRRVQRPVSRPVMRPRTMKVMTEENMGMSDAFSMGASNPVGIFGMGVSTQKPSIKQPTEKVVKNKKITYKSQPQYNPVNNPQATNILFGGINVQESTNKKTKSKQEDAVDILKLRGYW